MDDLRPESLKELEKEIKNHAASNKIYTGKALHDVWMQNAEETIRDWAVGGLHRVYEKTVLLAFMCKLQKQGWAFSESLSQSSKKIQEGILRSVRVNPGEQKETAHSSHQSRLAGQPAEPSNSLLELSQILARYSRQAWPETDAVNALSNFPLTKRISGRVGILRGAGNSIVPPLAAQFIQAFLEATGALTE